MKAFKKTVALLCAACVLTCSVAGLSVSASPAGDVDYAIANPYENVDWDTYSQYKADFHSHTTASDGTASLKDMTEAHYGAGYDIVAVTDHGIIDYGWTEQQTIPVMKIAIALFKDRDGKIIALNSDGGTAENGKAYSLVTKDGGDYYYQTDASGIQGQQMLRVPYGIEHNPTSINNAHVNSWFVDYGNGRLGGTSDYATPISNIEALKGLSVINHPGEYTGARDEVYSEDAYNTENVLYNYKINKFTSLLIENKSCLGIDINSKGDRRTRFDRKLWDILLQKIVPAGRNVFAFATSDAHGTDVTTINTGYTMMCMPSNTVANLRTCMEQGAFFAASKNLGSFDEINEIMSFLNKSTDAEALRVGAVLSERSASIAAEMADDGQGTVYRGPEDVEPPKVTRVAVDEAEDTITLSTDGNDLLIRWIANGELLTTGNSIDLDDYSDSIGSYVRVEIFGEGGIVYTQAFMLDYDGAPEAQEFNFVDLWFLASVIPDNIVRLVGALPIFDIIFKVMFK